MKIFSQDLKERKFEIKEPVRIAIKPSLMEFGKTLTVFKLIFKKVREGKTLEIEHDTSIKREEIAKIEKNELVAVFNPTWNETYTHCIIDIIPQLMYLEQTKKYDKIFTCTTAYLTKIIEELGLKFKKVEFISRSDFKFRSTKVDVFNFHPYAKIRNQELIEPLKKHVDGIKVAKTPNQKFIFCSRNGGNKSFKDSQNRRTMHEEIERVIIELSKKYAEKNKLDFLIFNGSNHDGSEMSVKDQIRLFKNAKVIVAPHGGALANLIYVKKSNGCKICEFTAGLNSEVQGVGNFAKNYNSLLGTFPETYLDYSLIPFTQNSKYNNKRIDLGNYLDFLESI